MKKVYKYHFVSNVTFCSDSSNFELSDIDYDEVACFNDELNEYLEKRKVNLAEYISEDSEIYGKVFTIDPVLFFAVTGNCFLTTLVESTEELTDSMQSELIDYVTGQYSDGWGEGFEQNPFAQSTDYEVYTYEDEETGEEVEDEQLVTYYYYAHVWNPRKFQISIADKFQDFVKEVV